jgi:hypothetical protein
VRLAPLGAALRLVFIRPIIWSATVLWVPGWLPYNTNVKIGGPEKKREVINVKRDRKRARRREQTIRIWSYAEARAVVPYVVSIMRSLRETKLEAQQQHRTAKRLALRPGRPDRSTLTAREDALEAARRADDRFHGFLEELHTLDVYCLDAVQGLALIPFAKDNQLAWWICDMYDSEPLRFWRYHRDTLETRRPIPEAVTESQGDSSMVI